MRYIFIGDVHGMLDELNSLLSKLDLRMMTRLYLLICDKGPDSAGVVSRVRTLSTTHDVIIREITRINTHDIKHCIRHTYCRRYGTQET